MTRDAIRIIGINPGTRYLGIAVLYGQELMDWRIKVLKGKWSREKMKRAIGIISEFIDRYEPSILAIKKLHPSRRSENLIRLTNKMKDYAKRRRIKVYQYSIKEIENFFLENEKLSKRNLIEALVNQFPILHHDLKNEQSHKNPYYFRMFEAVGLGTACAQNNLNG